MGTQGAYKAQGPHAYGQVLFRRGPWSYAWGMPPVREVQEGFLEETTVRLVSEG